MSFFEIGQVGNNFWSGLEFFLILWTCTCPCLNLTLQKVREGKFNVPHWLLGLRECIMRFLAKVVKTMRTNRTRDWEPVTISLQALSLVEKADMVQVHDFTLRSRDQRSMWMQDGCKVFKGSYMVWNGSCFMVTWNVFKNHLLEVGLTQKLGDHGTLNTHKPLI